jgi:uncharacterized protein YjbJ (UPF0337 family)/uncharacterized membrane protein (UPF0127 family)
MGPRRFRGLPTATVCGRRVPVAVGPLTRLLGLALLHRQRAGTGLLIPGCRSVHTVGMRFALDLVFVDEAGEPVRVERSVGPCRVVVCRHAAGVLELPVGVYGRCSRVGVGHSDEGAEMSIIDKITGRAKKAAGDVADDPGLRHEGRKEEKKGEAKDKLGRAEEKVEDKAQEVADLERRT